MSAPRSAQLERLPRPGPGQERAQPALAGCQPHPGPPSSKADARDAL
jgi:hypothetical protein